MNGINSAIKVPHLQGQLLQREDNSRILITKRNMATGYLIIIARGAPHERLVDRAVAPEEFYDRSVS
jgi:hypothetical protein